MTKKLKPVLSVIACVLIAAFMINQFFDMITYAVEDNLYLASVEIFTAPTKAEAKEKCEAAGFHAADADLNAGNVGGAVVIGYTVTDNPDEAITDLSVLEMNTGYEVSDYADIKESAMEKAGLVTSDFMKAVKEYRDNLENGSPKAIKAREILNIYVIPEKDNIGLGDYLAGSGCTEDFLKKIICQANAGVIYAIFNSISSGVADYGCENWAQRLETTEVKAQLAAGNMNALLDQYYKNYAYELCDQLQFFYENYQKAKSYADDNGVKSLADGVETVKEGDISDETVEKLENGEQFDEKEGYFLYLEAYEILGQYRYDENTSLADYILMLGSSSYKTDADLRKIYPLVDALTQGQIGVFRVSGVAQMALALVGGEDILDKTEESVKNLYDKLEEADKSSSGVVFVKDASGQEQPHLSLWVNTDQTQYNKKIAKTNANIISTKSGLEFDNLTKESLVDKTIDKIITLTYVISSAIDIATIITTIGVEIAAIHKLGVTAWLAGQSVSALTVCANAIAFTSGSIFTSILGILGCTALLLGYVAFAAIICVTLYQIGRFIYDLFADEDDSLDYTLDDIPQDVYDYRNQSYPHYLAVKLHGSGKPADLNAEKGRRFAALYYTKDRAVGEPIKINPDGDEFKVVSGDNTAPDGFEGVRYFGPGAVANLNSYAENKSAAPIFLSYYKSEPTAINEGEKSDSPETEKGRTEYLESLAVSVQKTEAAAKDDLKKKGYTLIDMNLTGFYGQKDGLYTYMGYKTTYIEKEAVKDIRVVPQGISTGSAFYFGNIPYTRAGGDDIPANIPSIYYTKSSDAGTPIYPDLQVTNSKSKAKAGFEPVNLFCGGDAYNLNATGDGTSEPMALRYTHWHDESNIFIYFHPSVTYTSGQQYIGGLAFFTGKTTTAKSGDEIKAYAEDNGFTVLGGNFNANYDYVFKVKHHVGKGTVTTEKKVDDIVTYLAYSVTYNPYRAIYGVKSYTALSPDVTALNELMVTNAADNSREAYAACNVFYQFGSDISAADNKITSFLRGIMPSNAWNGLNDKSHDTMPVPEIAEYPEQETDDFENYSWKSSAPRLKNLYVCGFIPGRAPLKVTDIRLLTDLKDEQACSEAGLYSVQDAKTPNRAQAHNIGFGTKNPMYLFIRQDKPSEGRYISSLSISSWNFDSFLGSDKQYKAMDEDAQEQIRTDYENTKDELCITTVMQTVADEIINTNLAVSFSESKQASPDNKPKQATYIGVTRTDNSAEAIHSIIKYKYHKPDKSDAELKIKVGGIEYTRVGREPVYDENFGSYFLYVSKSGGSPGEPITSLCFDDIPLIADCATALTAKDADTVEYSKGKEVTKTRAELKGYENETNYIHCGYETERTYICDVFIGTGNSEKAAMVELLNMGCNMFLPLDMNKNAGGKYIFVGYDKADSVDYAVRDIVCTVGKKAQPEIEIDGVTYQRARDRFIMNYDDSGAVSFNEGTNGYSIYLYYSYDTDDSPVMRLAAAERDYVPENNGSFIWENILTDTKAYCNFNDGVFASDNGYSIDTREYLYLNRDDNSIKDGIKLPRGSSQSTMAYGELKLASK